MNKKLAWGIIGTGRIAKTFAKGLAQSRTGILAAIGSREQSSADAFGKEFNVPHRHGSYEALLANREVQAVYISTPHPMHAEWAIKAADAGKHILCEKPLTINHAEAMAVVEAALRNKVFLMEAFMYRCHPQTARLIELLKAKVIGEVRVIQATFSFHCAFNPESRLLKNELGGGGILDVGCYTASMARLIAGVAAGKPFEEPVQLRATGHIGEVSRVDEYAVASLKFPGGILAELATGVQVSQESVVRIFGSEGSIFLPAPWLPRDGTVSKIMVHKKGEAQPAEVLVEPGAGLYTLEADAVGDYLEKGEAPYMTWEDSLGNMRTLDAWRESIGLVYDFEKPEAVTHTVSRRPLAVSSKNNMKYANLPGIKIPVSRLVMGVDHQTTMPQAAVLFDDYFERGGNCFDSAWVYRSGQCEKSLGQWVKNRGLRDKVIILDKGAHTPFCYPEDLTEQFLQSLDRLKTDYVDIYMMHRDNTDIPVGEFIDVLNEHQKAGRMKIFGASNWTLERIDEANRYAKSKGVQGFTAISNNFSLARMVEAPWKGCLSVSDEKGRAWLTKTQMPLMPWSSQARGFFAGRANANDLSDAELVRCWYSEDNFRRLERVKEMAAKRKVLPINIALAYVLCQPFPTFPLIGPRALSETRTSLPALDVELSPQELKWLNLEV